MKYQWFIAGTVVVFVYFIFITGLPISLLFSEVNNSTMYIVLAFISLGTGFFAQYAFSKHDENSLRDIMVSVGITSYIAFIMAFITVPLQIGKQIGLDQLNPNQSPVLLNFNFYSAAIFFWTVYICFNLPFVIQIVKRKEYKKLLVFLLPTIIFYVFSMLSNLVYASAFI